MTTKQIVIFTECNARGLTWSRNLGAYQVASHLRQAGYSVQVIDFVGFLSREEIFAAIDRYIGSETLAACFSISYLTLSHRDIYLNTDYSDDKLLSLFSERRKLIEDSYRKTTYPPVLTWPFENDVLGEIIDRIRSKGSHIRTIVGGTPVEGMTLDNEKLRGLSKYFDHFVGGYGENSITSLIRQIQAVKHSAEKSVPQILCFNSQSADFNFVESRLDWSPDDYIFSREVLPIEISRGCIFKCKFCSFPLNGKTRFDYIKNPSALYSELLSNYERFGTTTYMFCDDTFNDSSYKLELLYEHVISRLPFDINFFAYLRLDLIHRYPEQIELLRKMGIRYAKFGIESLNEETIKFIGKGFTFADIIHVLSAIKTSWGDDVFIDGSFIFGLPKETRASLLFMRDWLSEEGMEYFNSYSMFPLFLRHLTSELLARMSEQQKRQLSDLSANHANYGYEYTDENAWSWWRPDIGMGFTDMVELIADVHRATQHHPNLKLGQHIGIALHNLDIDFEQLKKLSKAELLSDPEVPRRYLHKIVEYKRKLLGNSLST